MHEISRNSHCRILQCKMLSKYLVILISSFLFLLCFLASFSVSKKNVYGFYFTFSCVVHIVLFHLFTRSFNVVLFNVVLLYELLQSIFFVTIVTIVFCTFGVKHKDYSSVCLIASFIALLEDLINEFNKFKLRI